MSEEEKPKEEHLGNGNDAPSAKTKHISCLALLIPVLLVLSFPLTLIWSTASARSGEMNLIIFMPAIVTILISLIVFFRRKGLADKTLAIIIIVLAVLLGVGGYCLNRSVYNNKKNIGVWLSLLYNVRKYQENSGGKNPPDLETLVQETDLTWKRLCDMDEDAHKGQSNYAYRGTGLNKESSGGMILFYSTTKHKHKGKMVHIVIYGEPTQRFLTFMTEEEFISAIAEDNKLRRELGLPEEPIKP